MAAPQLWAHSCSCWKDSSSVSGYCSRSHPAWNVDGMVNILFSICIRPSNFLPNLPQIQFTYCNVKYIHQTKYNSFNLLSKMLHPVFAYFYAPVVLIQRNSTELQMWWRAVDNLSIKSWAPHGSMLPLQTSKAGSCTFCLIQALKTTVTPHILNGWDEIGLCQSSLEEPQNIHNNKE